MAIEKLLRNKSHIEKSRAKSLEISKYKHAGVFDSVENKVRVEIIGDITPIEVNGQSGIQVFARAWREGKQLGFGQNGTVEIERFRIFNPPILVDDPMGTIVRTEIDELTKEVKTRILREDSKEALKQSLSHTIAITAQNGDNIVFGKIGNTTDTFYADAGGDGRAYYDNASSTWANTHDSGGNGHDSAVTSTYLICDSGNQVSPPYYRIATFFLPFDTSTIGAGSTISAAVLTVTTNSSFSTAGTDTAYAIATNQASGTALADSDYQTRILTAISSNGILNTDTSYGAKDLTITDLTKISKTGFSKLGLTFSNDINNSAPTPASGQIAINISCADTSGTTSDPKLVVTYTSTVDITVSPSAVTGSFATQAPAISGGATISSSALAGSFATQSPTVSGGAVVDVSALAGTFSLPTVDVLLPDVVVDASVVTGSFSLPSATETGDSNVTATTVTGSFSIGAPDVVIETSVAVNALGATFSLPSSTISATENITVSPSAITGTFSMPNPVVVISEINISIVPSPLTAVFSLPSSVVTTVRHITVSPSAVTGTFSTPSRIITADKWQNKFTTAGGTWNNKY